MRNLSIHKLFNQYASQHRPQFRFHGNSSADWRKWRDALRPPLLQALGRIPTSVPLNPELICQWEEDGLIKQKIYIDVEPGLSATAYVFRPAGKPGKLPAILACHGHGPFGKEAVMGVRSSAALAANISRFNYDYGLQMAKAGFVTMAIDWRGFGERDDREHSVLWKGPEGRDLCNLHYLRASMLGSTVLGMDIHDGKCAINYLCEQDYVDANRIGVMGLSFGGTMTTWMAICDERVKAADVICYSDRFAMFGMRDLNICGSQITPGIYELCDVPDLQGLIAPKPLLIEIGVHDDCFLVENANSCWEELRKIYAAAGVLERLELDRFGDGHRWGGNKSIPFFRKYLAEV